MKEMEYIDPTGKTYNPARSNRRWQLTFIIKAYAPCKAHLNDRMWDYIGFPIDFEPLIRNKTEVLL